MSKESEKFIEKMLHFFPSAKEEYFTSIEEFGEALETIIVEDIFMPKVIKLIDDNDNPVFLNQMFDYFEEVANSADLHLRNLFSVTVLEILGNDKRILGIAKEFMRPKTMQLQRKADEGLGRVNSSISVNSNGGK